MKRNIVEFCEAIVAYRQRLRSRIHAVKLADPRSHQRSPATRPAAKIESFRIGRQFIPPEVGKVAVEEELLFLRIKLKLIKRSPFLAEAGDSLRIDIRGPGELDFTHEAR